MTQDGRSPSADEVDVFPPINIRNSTPGGLIDKNSPLLECAGGRVPKGLVRWNPVRECSLAQFQHATHGAFRKLPERFIQSDLGSEIAEAKVKFF